MVSAALARIHSAISSSIQTTTFAEIRLCFGKLPDRSNRQIVVRERPVRPCTSSKRMNLIGPALVLVAVLDWSVGPSREPRFSLFESVFDIRLDAADESNLVRRAISNL